MQTLVWVTHIIYDGEISNHTCKKQLEELDESGESDPGLRENVSQVAVLGRLT
ncbi:MAG: hypothetical protein ACM3ZE_21125 [Myxococcales bacterium]